MKRDAGGIFGDDFSTQGEERMLITCDESGCEASYGSVECSSLVVEMARDSGWFVLDNGSAYCSYHRAKYEELDASEEEETPLRVEYRDRVSYKTPDWVGVMAVLWFAGACVLIGMMQDLRSQLHSAHFGAMLDTRDSFERKSLIERLDCNSDLPMQCSGLIIAEPPKPVRYSCDQDHCWFEIK